MTDRYEISSERWAIIEAIISPPQHMGRPRRDDRQMLDGIFWILCSGAKWRDLPERFGPWKTVYQRFRQWRDNGKFEQVLRHLHLRLREDGFIDLDTWMVDSTSIRASRAASGAEKKGAAGTATPLSRPKQGRTDHQNTPRLRQSWHPAGHYAVARRAG
ncbi:ISPs1, transposase OrfA [Pseudomonas amygdali pv. photiniae]|uniref:ISPs1, transposase OrfA n=1 Tax=Pseudomonas amygdali pv. photiniae TaxID=251724 RepID=A0A0P9U9J1_PSEA0|nr:ISPs1, transposase OrfA [Pseudomonas amygdali pv. photiniae]RMS40412.1 ISPs1, transposase OrfA [Pseudomonas amygdali pv. photiniae]